MSNALQRDLAKLVAAVDAAASECGHGAMASASILCRRRAGSTTPTVFAKRAACFTRTSSMPRLM